MSECEPFIRFMICKYFLSLCGLSLAWELLKHSLADSDTLIQSPRSAWDRGVSPLFCSHLLSSFYWLVSLCLDCFIYKPGILGYLPKSRCLSTFSSMILWPPDLLKPCWKVAKVQLDLLTFLIAFIKEENCMIPTLRGLNFIVELIAP